MASDDTTTTAPADDDNDVTDADGDAAAARLRLALDEASGWYWRLPLVALVGIASVWALAVANGYGRRLMDRDLALLEADEQLESAIDAGDVVPDVGGTAAAVILSRDLSGISYNDEWGIRNREPWVGLRLWHELPEKEAADSRARLRDYADYLERLSGIRELPTGPSPASYSQQLHWWSVRALLCENMLAAAEQGDWGIVLRDADTARVIENALLRRVAQYGQSGWALRGSLADLTLLRILERYGHDIPAPVLAEWLVYAENPRTGEEDVLFQMSRDSSWTQTLSRVKWRLEKKRPSDLLADAGTEFLVLRTHFVLLPSSVALATSVRESDSYSDFDVSTKQAAIYRHVCEVLDLDRFFMDYNDYRFHEVIYSIAREIHKKRFHRRLLVLAIRAQIYYREHESWPATPDELVPGASAWTDPSTRSGTLTFAQDAADCWRVYGLGYDEGDDGGMLFWEWAVLDSAGERLFSVDTGFCLGPPGWRPRKEVVDE